MHFNEGMDEVTGQILEQIFARGYISFMLDMNCNNLRYTFFPNKFVNKLLNTMTIIDIFDKFVG